MAVQKIVGMLNTRILEPLGARLVSNRPMPALTARHAQRFFLFADMFKAIEGVSGCIVECGVAYGRGLLYLSYLAQHEGAGRMIYGLDTFEGYPSVSKRDEPLAEGYVPPEKGGLAVPQAETERFLRQSKIDPEFLKKYVRLIKGDVVNTTKNFAFGPIALLITEMDMYSGTKAALENLGPHMAPGGVVLPLNYGHGEKKFPGGHKAVEEVFADRIDTFKLNPQTGKRYFVNKA